MYYKPEISSEAARYSLKQVLNVLGRDEGFLFQIINRPAGNSEDWRFSFKDLVVLSVFKFAKDSNLDEKLLPLLNDLVGVIGEQSEPFENPFQTDFLSHLNFKDLKAEVLGQSETSLFLHPKSPKVMMTLAAGGKLVFARFYTVFNEKPLTSRIANNLQIIYPADESVESKKVFVKVTKDHQFTDEYEAESPVTVSIDLNKIHHLVVKRLTELA